MEFFIYTSLTIITWALSVTCLLPFVIVLKISKVCRGIWFSWVFVRVCEHLMDSALGKVRRYGFKFLEEHLPKRKGRTPLEILEIGFGGGMNLSFYPENSVLTAVDDNASFTKYFEENLKKNPQVNCKKVIIGMVEDMHELDDDSFDIVVGTYVLCSVKSVRSALKEVKRVLKPGGKYLFVEHILYPKFGWESILQMLINPLWKVYFDDCHINRNQYEEIKKAGFSDVVTEMCYRKELWIYVRPMMIGVATK